MKKTKKAIFVAVFSAVLLMASHGISAEDGDVVVIGCQTLWRQHYSLMPPVYSKEGNVEEFKFRRFEWKSGKLVTPPPAGWTWAGCCDGRAGGRDHSTG